MKSKEYNYIKLCYLIKYVFIAIFIIRALFFIIFSGKETNDVIVGLIIWSAIILYLFKGFDLEGSLIKRELKRRMDKLPIPKENNFS